MGHYLLYRQESFWLKEQFEDVQQGVQRKAALSEAAHFIHLFDFDTAPKDLLNLAKYALEVRRGVFQFNDTACGSTHAFSQEGHFRQLGPRFQDH